MSDRNGNMVQVGEFVVFPKREGASERAPNYNGHFSIEGNKYEFAAWLKLDKTGKKFLSGVISREADAASATPPDERATPPDDGSGLPF